MSYLIAVITLLLVIVVAIPVGALVALPALLLPIQRLGQSRVPARRAVIFIWGLVAFVVAFGASTRLVATVSAAFYGPVLLNMRDSALTPAEQSTKAAVINEVWIREMAPPLMRGVCYTGQETACRMADQAVSRAGTEKAKWEMYVTELVFAFVSALTSGALVWLFIRHKSTA